MKWRLRCVVPATAVTIHAKPHAQLQLARDLEVERAAMGQSGRPARCSEAIRSHVNGWICGELLHCCCTARKQAESERATSPLVNF